LAKEWFISANNSNYKRQGDGGFLNVHITIHLFVNDEIRFTSRKHNPDWPPFLCNHWWVTFWTCLQQNFKLEKSTCIALKFSVISILLINLKGGKNME
jgi:hypothetical protein